ncbi:TetR/AcrR family transcriptional regulator [[Actinomadura] parvosata]|uniref:TetR/AcrR family transcriptional regulator n=1 Tax=[Actinomadura] parvosata TaxID=1955412 RepID=UPI00406D03E8
MESPQQRRDRRRAEKQQAIRRAAVRIALDQGVEAATVEAISAAADISPRTFFNYFASKEEALTPEPPWRPEEFVGLLTGRPADEPVFESLKAVARELVVRIRPAMEDLEPFMELRRRHPELAAKARAVDETKVMESLLGAVRSRPGVTGPMHARLLVIATFGATISAVQESVLSGEPAEALLEEAFTLLESGF